MSFLPTDSSHIAWTAILVIWFSILFSAMGLFTRKDHFPVKGRVCALLSLDSDIHPDRFSDSSCHWWIPRNGKRSGQNSCRKGCQCYPRCSQCGEAECCSGIHQCMYSNQIPSYLDSTFNVSFKAILELMFLFRLLRPTLARKGFTTSAPT